MANIWFNCFWFAPELNLYSLLMICVSMCLTVNSSRQFCTQSLRKLPSSRNLGDLRICTRPHVNACYTGEKGILLNPKNPFQSNCHSKLHACSCGIGGPTNIKTLCTVGKYLGRGRLFVQLRYLTHVSPSSYSRLK